jgi:hypothetical protein
MNTQKGFAIAIDGVSGRAAAESASGLYDRLKAAYPELAVERFKADEKTQDDGSIIGIVLGAQATIEFVKGLVQIISEYLRAKNSSASFEEITIEQDGKKRRVSHRKAMLKGAEAQDSAKVAQAVFDLR